eukprot:3211847-Amphidinium_carterae.1
MLHIGVAVPSPQLIQVQGRMCFVTCLSDVPLTAYSSLPPSLMWLLILLYLIMLKLLCVTLKFCVPGFETDVVRCRDNSWVGQGEFQL